MSCALASHLTACPTRRRATQALPSVLALAVAGLTLSAACPHLPWALGAGGALTTIALTALPLRRRGRLEPETLGDLDAGLPPVARVLGTVDEVPAADWARVVGSDTPSLALPYLRALADGAPPEVEHRYALLYRGSVALGAAYFQSIAVRPENLGEELQRWPHAARGFLTVLRGGHRRPVRVLVCGNVFHSESRGFVHTGELSAAAAGDALARLCEDVRREQRADLVLLKDLEVDAPGLERLQDRGYHPVQGSQPVMVVPLEASWRGFDDYLKAMSSKYRSRATSARRKGAALRRRPLGIEELVARRPELEPLLEAVTGRAGFKLATITFDTLVALQARLGDTFRVVAYEHQGRALGFAASLVESGRLEGLFVGLDYEANERHALYPNMLYDFVEEGLARGCESVHLGRTALEIKSTVGAAPKDQALLLRHPWAPLNSLLGAVLRRLPAAPWVQRRPFVDGRVAA